MTIETALLVGALGDASLQAIVKSSEEKNKFGLMTYFEQHGTAESIFTAAGMMGVFTALYDVVDPQMMSGGLIAYGAILDLIFRYARIMPSLDDYYKKFNPLLTIIFAIVPFFMVKYSRSFIESNILGLKGS